MLHRHELASSGLFWAKAHGIMSRPCGKILWTGRDGFFEAFKSMASACIVARPEFFSGLWRLRISLRANAALGRIGRGVAPGKTGVRAWAL